MFLCILDQHLQCTTKSEATCSQATKKIHRRQFSSHASQTNLSTRTHDVPHRSVLSPHHRGRLKHRQDPQGITNRDAIWSSEGNWPRGAATRRAHRWGAWPAPAATTWRRRLHSVLGGGGLAGSPRDHKLRRDLEQRGELASRSGDPARPSVGSLASAAGGDVEAAVPLGPRRRRIVSDLGGGSSRGLGRP